MTTKMGDRQRANRRFKGLVNAEEAGHILDRTRRTICSWEKAGKMPPRANAAHHRIRLYRQTDIEDMARRLQMPFADEGRSTKVLAP